MEAIKVKNLDFYYDEDTHAVNDVSFNIQKGSYTTIIGHNGSGKSTIAKLLLGLLEKKNGSILINNLDLNIDNLYKIRTQVGIVFQNPDNQFIGSTVRDDIAFGLENHCVESSKMEGIINKYAEKVGMEDFLDKEPTKLSGGQKQRVAIAGVLAMHPDIIVFDEATSMLDPQGKDEINKAIFSIHDNSDITILSITHDIEEVAKSDYVMVMNDGKLIMSGKPKDILVKKDDLVKVHLDTSFAMKLSLDLKAKGIEINEQLDMEGLVDELCRLNSNN
jgi:energy-coupling factor transport system ATP-binding protein